MMRLLAVVLAVAACGPTGHAPIGNTPRRDDSLAAVLEREVGSGHSVAIVGGPSLRAISSDGLRERVLVAAAAPWVLVDQRARVVWFSSPDRSALQLIDLDANGPVRVETAVENLGFDTNGGSQSFMIAYGTPRSQDRDELTFLDETVSRFVLELGATPRLDLFGMFLEQMDDTKARREVITHARIPDPQRLVALAGRGTGRTSQPVAALTQVATIPESQCLNRHVCGVAQPLAHTSLWRVITAEDCGDGCFIDRQIYDPATQQLWKQPWGEHVSDMWLAPDGSAYVQAGVVYRFDVGALPRTPAEGAGAGGGWLGAATFYGL